MPTQQELFDKAVAHLRQQGDHARARNDYHLPQDMGSCRYRTADGKKCAIGCLISDADYTPDLEFKNVNALWCMAKDDHPLTEAIKGDFRKLLLEHDVKFLSALQAIHDANNVYGWEKAIENVAAQYKLTVPVKPVVEAVVAPVVAVVEAVVEPVVKEEKKDD
jgi:hypothetical protein